MTTSTGHFNVSQKTATALGLDVISILPHVVSVRTDKGPRFVSRKDSTSSSGTLATFALATFATSSKSIATLGR